MFAKRPAVIENNSVTPPDSMTFGLDSIGPSNHHIARTGDRGTITIPGREDNIRELSKHKHEGVAHGGELSEMLLTNVEADEDGIPSKVRIQQRVSKGFGDRVGKIHDLRGHVITSKALANF